MILSGPFLVCVGNQQASHSPDGTATTSEVALEAFFGSICDTIRDDCSLSSRLFVISRLGMIDNLNIS